MQVTRTSATFRKPDDWSKWLFTKKMSADRNSLWEYVDPDLSPEKLKKLEDERPIELEVRRFRTPFPNEQIDIPDLTATELATYNAWSRRFIRRINIPSLLQVLLQLCVGRETRVALAQQPLFFTLCEQNTTLRQSLKHACRKLSSDLDDAIDSLCNPMRAPNYTDEEKISRWKRCEPVAEKDSPDAPNPT
jgi:hypothetical protein